MRVIDRILEDQVEFIQAKTLKERHFGQGGRGNGICPCQLCHGQSDDSRASHLASDIPTFHSLTVEPWESYFLSAKMGF